MKQIAHQLNKARQLEGGKGPRLLARHVDDLLSQLILDQGDLGGKRILICGSNDTLLPIGLSVTQPQFIIIAAPDILSKAFTEELNKFNVMRETITGGFPFAKSFFDFAIVGVDGDLQLIEQVRNVARTVYAVIREGIDIKKKDWDSEIMGELSLDKPANSGYSKGKSAQLLYFITKIHDFGCGG